MKILFISLTFPGDVTDGAGQVFKEYYDRLKHSLMVLTGLWKKKIDAVNIHQLKVSNKKFIGLFQFIFKVRKFLKHTGSFYDVIHCNVPKSAFPVALFKKFKFICTIHDLRCFEERGSYFERKIVKFVSKRADKILTDSYEIKKQFKRFLPKIDQKKIEVLYVGINERFKNLEKEGQLLKERLHCKEKVILYVGRITKYKGLEDIIDAFRRFKREYEDTSLVIVGLPDFNMKKTYFDWEELIINNYFIDIKIVGFVSDEELPTYYSMADLFITLPYKGEGFGLTPLESLFCGTPIICSDIPIFREILGKSAIYSPPRSPEMLHYYIRWFFRNGIHNFRGWQIEEIIEKYQWEKIILQLEDIYNNFINE